MKSALKCATIKPMPLKPESERLTAKQYFSFLSALNVLNIERQRKRAESIPKPEPKPNEDLMTDEQLADLRQQSIARVNQQAEIEERNVQQLKADLATGLQTIEAGHWASFHVLLKRHAKQTRDRAETITCLVLEVRPSSQSVLLQVECYPDGDDVHGIKYGQQIEVPMGSLTSVRKGEVAA